MASGYLALYERLLNQGSGSRRRSTRLGSSWSA
jgi:hypothetical protein